MTDRDMTRSDWLNEAWSPSEDAMEAADNAVRAEVADLLTSLIAIGPAVSRSELETTIKRLRDCEAYSSLVNSAIADALDTVEYYHAKALHAQTTGHGFSLGDMGEDLAMRLEDFQ